MHLVIISYCLYRSDRLFEFLSFIFFFNDTATTEIYTLSLHDALPIYPCLRKRRAPRFQSSLARRRTLETRSEEHTSELQSRPHLVCRLLLEKKKSEPTASEGSETFVASQHESQAR